TTNRTDRRRHTRSNIDRLVIRGVRLQRQKIGAHDVADVYEVSCLFTVLKHHGPVVIEQTSREDRTHARVRIRECLPCAVYVEVAQSNRGYSVRTAHRETKLLLVLFCHRINRRRKERLLFGSRRRRELFTTLRTQHFPLPFE